MGAGVDDVDGAVEGASSFTPGSARSVLRYPTFRRVCFGAFLSNTGTWMQNVVLGTLAYDLTESSTFVGLVVFAQLGPFLLLSMVGGLMADRLDRRRLLVGVAMVQLALSFVLAAIVSPEDPNRALLLGAVFAMGVGQSIYAPTFAALLPQLVRDEDLAGAISFNSAQMNASRVIGPVIGAFLYSRTSASAVFMVNGLSFVFLMVALLPVRLPRPSLDHTAARGFRALVQGVAIARQNSVVGRCLVTISLYSLISLPFIGQLPVVAERNLGVDGKSTGYGLLYACFGCGAVIGALSIGTVFSKRAKADLVRVALVGFSLSLGVLALMRSPAPAYPIIAVVGFCYFALVTSLMTVIQEQVGNRVRGRVMALWLMGWGGMVPLGNLVAGPVIEATSVTLVMLVGAGFALLLTAYARVDRPSRASANLAPAPACAPGR